MPAYDKIGSSILESTMNYYPKKLKLSPGGTKSTIEIIEKNYSNDDHFNYAELGIYKAETAEYILKNFSNASVDLFDFEDTIDTAKKKFSKYGDRVNYFSNSYKFCDSYNYNLLNLIEQNSKKYDYVFLDGAHTFVVDGLAYFLIDILLSPGGYIDFDDYNWTLDKSSLNPSLVPETGLCYTDEQIKRKQVKDIVDVLVKRNLYYTEIVKNKVYQKVKNDI